MITKNIFLGLALNMVYIFGKVNTKTVGEPISIGRFYECAHGLKGEVWILNDRQLQITGFEYSGGPDPSFHGQLEGSKGIYTSDKDMYVTLPYPNDECGRLYNRINTPTITLTLPRSIKDFETIGIFCYRYCHNFGHVHIPKNLNVLDAPSSVQKVNECSKEKNNNKCQLNRQSDNYLFPNCPGGNRESINLTFVQITVEEPDIETTSSEAEGATTESNEVTMTTNVATEIEIVYNKVVVMMIVFVIMII